MKSTLVTILLLFAFIGIRAQDDAAASDSAQDEGTATQATAAAPATLTLSDARITGWQIHKHRKSEQSDEGDDADLPDDGTVSFDFGDTLVVEVENLNALIEAGLVNPSNVFMHWDEVNLSPISAKRCCVSCDELTFVVINRFLNQKTKNQIKMLAGLSDVDVGVSLYIGTTPWLDCCSPSLNVHLRVFRKNLGWSTGFAIGLLILLFWLARTTNLLRNTVSSAATGKRPYSLSRVQLAFWTFIILSSFFYIYVATGEAGILNNTALFLLGISSATAAVAQVIDTNDARNTDLRASPNNKGGNWLVNIISDENGISIHRLQTVVFNLIFGIIFIQTVVTSLVLPEFNTTQLALLGISNATYSALKVNERPGAAANANKGDETVQNADDNDAGSENDNTTQTT